MLLTFVLDNIRSAWNVGSIFRTADALQAKICLVGYTPRPVGKTLELIKKTAIGAEKSVYWQHFETVQDVLFFYPSSSKLKHIAIEINQNSQDLLAFLNLQIGAKMKNLKYSYSLENLNNFSSSRNLNNSLDLLLNTKKEKLLTKKYITKENLNYFLWFGNEISGLSSETIQNLDQVLHLPMQGSKESLNVANCVCAVAYLFEFVFNQLKFD